MNKKEEANKGRTIARTNARELTPEEVAIVSGGNHVLQACTCANTCWTCGGPDDIVQN